MTIKNISKQDKKEVFELIKEFRKHNLIDDRLEYDVDDLMSAYPQLSKKQAEFLFKELRRRYR